MLVSHQLHVDWFQANHVPKHQQAIVLCLIVVIDFDFELKFWFWIVKFKKNENTNYYLVRTNRPIFLWMQLRQQQWHHFARSNDEDHVRNAFELNELYFIFFFKKTISFCIKTKQKHIVPAASETYSRNAFIKAACSSTSPCRRAASHNWATINFPIQKKKKTNQIHK